MSKINEYPLFSKWYKILDWILDRCEGFPKDVRFTLANRISNLALDIMEKIIEAVYTKKRQPILYSINLKLEKLRILFRIVKDRKLLSFKQYEFISLELNEAGKMVGGWLKK